MLWILQQGRGGIDWVCPMDINQLWWQNCVGTGPVDNSRVTLQLPLWSENMLSVVDVQKREAD